MEWWVWKTYREWSTISTLTWEEKEIFFSDGSVSVLEWDSTVTLNKLNFKWGNNLNTIVKLALWAGTIWTRATHLNDESEFEVYTTDSAAAVRWTIFWISKNWGTELTVIEWAVDIYETNSINEETIQLNTTNLEKLETLSSTWIVVKEWESPKTTHIYKHENSDPDSTEPAEYSIDTYENIDAELPEEKFSENEKVRTEEEVALVTEEVNEEIKWNSCYLEWVEIQDRKIITAYISQEPEAWASCESEPRECRDWILSWTYKYLTCDGQCPRYIADWYDSENRIIKTWTTYDFTKISTDNWTITYNRNVTCNTYWEYIVNEDKVLSFDCNQGYHPEDVSCENDIQICSIWTLDNGHKTWDIGIENYLPCIVNFNWNDEIPIQKDIIQLPTVRATVTYSDNSAKSYLEVTSMKNIYLNTDTGDMDINFQPNDVNENTSAILKIEIIK